MSQINVNRIKDSNEGAPDFPSGVNVGGITSTVTLGVTNLNPTNVNVSGVVTATTFDGTLLSTGTPTLGLGVTINTSGLNISGVATAGIVSATTLFGNGANITGIALTIAPLNYNPAVSGVNVSPTNGIGLTFNQGVKAGSGNVTLRLVGAAGTVVENFGVGNSVTYGHSDYGTTISINPTADLEQDTSYHLSYPSGAFTNIGGDVSYVGTAYTFDSVLTVYQLWSMGSGDPNNRGMAGTGSPSGASSPVQIPGTTWSEVSSASFYAHGLKTDGTLWAWGYNPRGVLGQNQATAQLNQSDAPIQIPGTTWSALPQSFGGAYGVKALKTDGTLWSWGYNYYGALGLNEGSNSHKSSPTQIPGTTWSSTFSTGYNSIAVKTDGTMWTWGDNEKGALGQNTEVGNTVNSPVQVPGTTWGNSVAGNQFAGFAIKTDGTLWGWGSNSSGALGQNNRTDYSSPVQVPGTNWKNLQGAPESILALKTDNTLWGIGTNEAGQLGQNSPHGTKYSSPVQIPGTTWSDVFSGSQGSYMASKTDGTLWAWGNQSGGQFGLNNRTQYSSPVQVPGTWNAGDIGSSGQVFFVLKGINT